MHPQIREIEELFESALAVVNRLAADYTAEEWSRPPPGGGWSAAQCVTHLNITSRANLSSLNEGIARAREIGDDPPSRLRRDPVGWMIWKSVLPTTRMKVKTGEAFVPSETSEKDQAVAEFEALQAEQLERTRESDGLPIQKVKLVSVFAKNVRYSLYSLLSILAVHQHRHLQQAERALQATE